MIDSSAHSTHPVAVVSGGASGLGWAIASALLQSGATVIILDLKVIPNIEELYAGHLFSYVLDITQEDHVAAAITAIVEKIGRVVFLLDR